MNEIRIIRVWIGNDFIEFEEEKTADMSERISSIRSQIM